MTDIGERLKNLTVKIESPNRGQTWSGFIIGSITTNTNRPVTVIMSCTHSLGSSDDNVLVSFYRQHNTRHDAHIVWFWKRSDILVVIVNHHHTYDYPSFANVYTAPMPMPLLTTRQVHCVGYANGHKWIYHHGYIASELTTNDAFIHNMTVFGLRCGTSRGCVVVNDALDVLGILNSGHGDVLNLLGANSLPPPNMAQTEEQYQAYLDVNTTILHGARFVAHNNLFMPHSSLSFAISVRCKNKRDGS